MFDATSAKRPCPQCGAAGALTIAQSSPGGRLGWYESVNCGNCGLRSEADGLGFPPDDMRELMVEEGGLWCVRLDEARSTAGVATVLREALGLGLNEAVRLVKASPGALNLGTREEGRWLVGLLERAGESVALELAGERIR